MGAANISAGLRETGEMIAFKHTVFALPFAIIALITAAAPGWPSLSVWLWVAVAMVSARTAAMAFNRLADHRFDAENPRTAERALPAGRLSRRFAWAVTGLSAALFVVAGALFGIATGVGTTARADFTARPGAFWRSGVPVQPFDDVASPDKYEAALDGNDVSIEQQLVKLNETQMSYQMTLNLYKKNIDMLRLALGRR